MCCSRRSQESSVWQQALVAENTQVMKIDTQICWVVGKPRRSLSADARVSESPPQMQHVAFVLGSSLNYNLFFFPATRVSMANSCASCPRATTEVILLASSPICSFGFNTFASSDSALTFDCVVMCHFQYGTSCYPRDLNGKLINLMHKGQLMRHRE